MAHTVREWNLNPTGRYVFVWLLIFNRSDYGLIDTPKLVTSKSVNFVVHDSGLEYIHVDNFHTVALFTTVYEHNTPHLHVKTYTITLCKHLPQPQTVWWTRWVIASKHLISHSLPPNRNTTNKTLRWPTEHFHSQVLWQRAVGCTI
jgi:hypothetical protein